MAKATRKLKARSLPNAARRTRVGPYERSLIEAIVSSAGRAHQLVHDTWTSKSITPLMVSAICRDLLVEIGVVKGAARNLAEAYPAATSSRPRAI